MKLLFPFVLFFSLIFTMLLKKSSISFSQQAEALLEKERTANSTRKKDISNLDYITIPYEKLPFLEKPSERVKSYEQDILYLKDQKILNLNGISNTELKLTYGAANLPDLMQYDENYIRLVAILGKWAQALMDENYVTEAQTVLEVAVEAGCDSSSIYLNLASIYQSTDINKMPYLIEKINASSSPMKKTILEKISTLSCSADSSVDG